MKNFQETSRMTSHWRKWATASALVLATVATAAPAWAQTAIRSINSTQQAGVEVLRIELNEPLKEVPKGFTIQTPPRIAIDLPGVGNAMGRPSVEINQGNVRSAAVAQSGDRTRLVLNLRQASG